MVTTLTRSVAPRTHPAPARHRTASDMDTPCAGHCCRRLTSRDRTRHICPCEYLGFWEYQLGIWNGYHWPISVLEMLVTSEWVGGLRVYWA